MNPYLVKFLPIAKQLALRAVSHKLKEESLEKKTLRELSGDPAPIEFSGNKLGAMGSVYTVVLGAVLAYLSSKGIIDPALYELILTIASNPEVIKTATDMVN